MILDWLLNIDWLCVPRFILNAHRVKHMVIPETKNILYNFAWAAIIVSQEILVKINYVMCL